MINIVDIRDLIGQDTSNLDNSFDNKYLFAKVVAGKRAYNGIYIVNYQTKEVFPCNFQREADLLALNCSGSSVYYAYIDNKRNDKYICLRKIDCSTLSDQDICKISIKSVDSKNFNEIISALSIIIGINERYCIVFVPIIFTPKTFPKHGIYFSNCLLIDSIEKKAYPVPDQISESDTLLRLDRAWVVNNGKYIMFKTGRIRPFEKKEIWEKGREKGVYKEYGDHLEALLLYKTEEFVNNVKNGFGLKNNIIASCDLHGSLAIIGVDHDNIVYCKRIFKDASTKVNFYSLSSMNTVTNIIDELYDGFMFYNQKLYGIVENIKGKYNDIYDISTKSKLIRLPYSRTVIYINKDYVISYNILEKKILVENLVNGDLIQTFESGSVRYDFENNQIILY